MRSKDFSRGTPAERPAGRACRNMPRHLETVGKAGASFTQKRIILSKKSVKTAMNIDVWEIYHLKGKGGEYESGYRKSRTGIFKPVCG